MNSEVEVRFLLLTSLLHGIGRAKANEQESASAEGSVLIVLLAVIRQAGEQALSSVVLVKGIPSGAVVFLVADLTVLEKSAAPLGISAKADAENDCEC